MSFEAKRGLLTIRSPDRGGAKLFAHTGFRPRALLLWWVETDHGLPCGNRGGIGIHANGSGVAHAWFADDQIATDALAGGGGEFAFVALDAPFFAAPACSASATLDHLGFTLEWQATRRGSWDVHYLAFGGSDLRRAAIARVELSAEQRRVVAEVGFRPDFALFIPTAATGGGNPASELFYGIGVTTGPDRQSAAGVAARLDGASAVVRSAQRDDAVVALPSLPNVSGEEAFRVLARTVGLGPAGPELDVAADAAAPPLSVACLALAGGRYSVLMHAGPARPGRMRTRGVGFPAVGILAFGRGLPSTKIKEVPRLSMGAADRSGSGCVSWTLRPRGLWPLEPRSRSTEGRLFEVPDTRSHALHAHARLTEVRAKGFTLEWPESDGHQRRFVYAAFGSTKKAQRKPRPVDVVVRHLFTRRHA